MTRTCFLALCSLLLGACSFNAPPPLAFHCTASNPGCPDGYECNVAQELCVKKGASLQELATDLGKQEARADLPTLDGPGADLPDGPGADLPRVDSKLDQSKADTRSDLRKDGPPTCKPGLCLDGTACVASKSVPCNPNNNNPANSTDTVVNVTVACQSSGTFAAPALCGWTCNLNYCLDGGLCLGSKSVPCDTNNNNPTNSTDTIANVIVACQPSGTFAAPADCGWTCNSGYYLDANGKACVRPLYLVDAGPAQGVPGGNRAAMDARCAAAITANYKGLGTTVSAGFISSSSADSIATLPSTRAVPKNRPILGPTKIRIADSWADLLDGTIKVTLSSASVTTNYWFSGSTDTGTVTTHTCNAWTATSGNDGTYGRSSLTDSQWIWDGDTGHCGGTYHYLCLAWLP